MSQAHAAESGGTFTRAFLPGLILGLVVGGICGAVLPDLVGGSPKLAPPTGVPTHGERDERSGPSLEELKAQAEQAADQAGERIEEGAEAAGEVVDDAADAVEDAVDDLAAPGRP